MFRTLVLVAVAANVVFIVTSEATPECNEDQCTGANEIYDKCPDCSPQTCESIGKIYNCPMINTKNCKPACRCETGYYRNNDKECIPEDQCPNKCKGNEVYDECPNVCQPQTCDQHGTVVYCPVQNENGTCTTEPACVCQDGYLRNENGVCIPTKECTSCGRDPNAVPGCGINCNKHCSDYNKEPKACILLCKTNACDCKDGYYLDDNTGKCVKPEDCTPPCGENQRYDMCVNGGCDKRNCSQINDPRICIDPLECEGGCICSDGYLRANNGTCVPQDECPKASCHDDPNTVPGCSNYCGKSCTDYNTGPKACPLICLVDGCDCKEGYVYDSSIEKCVLPEDCPPTTT